MLTLKFSTTLTSCPVSSKPVHIIGQVPRLEECLTTGRNKPSPVISILTSGNKLLLHSTSKPSASLTTSEAKCT